MAASEIIEQFGIPIEEDVESRTKLRSKEGLPVFQYLLEFQTIDNCSGDENNYTNRQNTIHFRLSHYSKSFDLSITLIPKSKQKYFARKKNNSLRFTIAVGLIQNRSSASYILSRNIASFRSLCSRFLSFEKPLPINGLSHYSFINLICKRSLQISILH